MAHILVVDDDPTVRDVIVDMLTDSGFEVTAVGGGAAMRAVLAAGAMPVDAVILDWTLPGEVGADLALYVKGQGLPVLMVSGSQETIKFAEEHGLQLLLKPFRLAALIKAVEVTLAQVGKRESEG